MSNDYREGCTAFTPGLKNQYDYVPSRAAGIVFIALFGVSTFFHLVQTLWTRQWWTLLFAIGSITEVIGWVGRTWSASCPYNNDAFLIQIVTLIIAPVFWTAALYVILGRLINLAGRHTSPISAKTYLIVFCISDLVSLIVQAIGGGLASVASSATPPEDTEPGTNIMVAGIIFQMAAITVFCGLFGLFLVRASKTSKNGSTSALTPGIKLLVAATTASIVFIYVRSIYRTIELLQGWEGYLITHEVYFIILDGAMMVAAVAVFNVVHPGYYLKQHTEQQQQREEYGMEERGEPSVRATQLRYLGAPGPAPSTAAQSMRTLCLQDQNEEKQKGDDGSFRGVAL